MTTQLAADEADAFVTALPNRMVLGGSLLERGALRFTPAGIAVCDAVIAHESEQTESGGQRRVLLHMPVRLSGEVAQSLVKEALGSTLVLQGYIAHRRLGRDGSAGGSVLFHATAYRIQDSIQDIER